MPEVRSVFDQLGRLLGRALSLEDAAASALGRLAAMAAIALLGWIAYRGATAVIRHVLRPLESAGEAPNGPGGAAALTRAQRARTLRPLLSSVARYVMAFVVGVLILQELGLDVRALMVSAGVAGLAIGFGAQSLIKDVISGFFILFENLIAVGDVIEVGSHTGVVESVGLRVTKIRKFSGELRIVPNGEITNFGHYTAGWSRAVVEVGIGYDQDVGRALQALEAAGRELRTAFPAAVLEPPAAQGILRFGESDVVLRVHARVDALQRFDLELELRRRVKAALEAAGIAIPFPQRVVHLVPDGRSPIRFDKERLP